MQIMRARCVWEKQNQKNTFCLNQKIEYQFTNQ